MLILLHQIDKHNSVFNKLCLYGQEILLHFDNVINEIRNFDCKLFYN